MSAASSLRAVLQRAAAMYAAEHPGSTVRMNIGASNLLARQIGEGAPVDLFFAADERSMDEAAGSGRVLEKTRLRLLSNGLVVIVPVAAPFVPARPEDLGEAAVRRVALCDGAVPAGRYARAWLASKGLLAGIEEKAVRPDDARAALAMVESGAVEAGFVFRTDAKSSSRARVAFEIPPSETPGIVYPAAALRDGPNPEGGRALLDFLASGPVMELFEEAGFEIVRER